MSVTRRFIFRIFLLGCMLPMSLLGCSKAPSPNIHKRWTDHAIFCNGKSVFMIHTYERSTWGGVPNRHSGGYRSSLREDSWLVEWPLKECNENRPTLAKATFAGVFHETQTPARYDIIEKSEGYPSGGLLPIGDSTQVVHLGDALTVLRNGIKVPFDCSVYALRDLNGDRNVSDRYIFSQDRRYCFALNHMLTICSLRGEANHPVIDTKELRSFFKLSQSNSEHKRILLNDLSGLVSVPERHVRGIDRGQDYKSPCAYHYRFDNNTLTTIRFDRLPDMGIDDCYNTADGLRWMVCLNASEVYRKAREGKWAIVDSNSNIDFKFGVIVSEERDFNAYPFWDQENDLVWVVRVPNGSISPPDEKMIIYKHDLKTSIECSYELLPPNCEPLLKSVP